jgi:hypothetical protein
LGEDDLILVKFKYGFPPPPLWRETPWDQMQPDWHRSSLYELVPQPYHSGQETSETKMPCNQGFCQH